MMAYAYPGVDGRFSPGISNPSQNVMLRSGTGLRKPLGQTKPTKPISVPLGDPQQASIGGWGKQAPNPDQFWAWGGSSPEVPGYVGGPEIPGYTGGAGSKGGAQYAGAEYVRPTAGPADFVGADYTGANYTAYDPRSWSDQPNVNTREVVAAFKPQLEEEMAQNMGEASRRFGASGAIRSSGHRRGLESAERKMFGDLNALEMKYGYDASQQDANRSLQAFSDFERRRAAEAGRRTGFDQSEAARRTGFDVGQAGAENAYNQYAYGADVGEAARETGFNQNEAARETGFNLGQQGAENQFNQWAYGAGAGAADKQNAYNRWLYEQMKQKFGV